MTRNGKKSSLTGKSKSKPKGRSGSDKRNPNAVALGAMGASSGGKARASKLTPRERSRIARKGGKSRS